MRRVVITGAATSAPWAMTGRPCTRACRECRNAVRHYEDWSIYAGLNTRLGVPAAPFELARELHRARARAAWAASR
jgi:3-oxoacyl-[acyl-carrier-protein] synthase II